MGQDGFLLGHRLGLLLVSLALAGLIFELVRRGYLKERFALLWLTISFAGLCIGVFPQLIERISFWLEFQYLTVFWTASFVFLLFSVLAFTVVISRLSERSRELAQEVALLAQRLEELERSPDARR
jgi:hypothetical protein